MTNDVRREFSDRIASLGGFCWWCDAESATPSGRICNAFDPALIRATAVKLAAAARTKGRPVVESFSAEYKLVGFPPLGGRAPVAAFGLPDADRFVSVAGHYFADLNRDEHHRIESEEFAERLSQSFEEVNFVFRTARILHGTEDPAGVMRAMCDELKSVLPFQWLAIRFTDRGAVLPALRGQLITAGKPPVEDFDNLTRNFCQDMTGPVIRTPSNCELAALTGAEVLVQAVMHEGTPVGLILAGNRTGSTSDISSNETQLVSAAAGFLGLFHENVSRFVRQRAMFVGTLQALTAAVDAKDPYTRGHSDRVGLLASQMAIAMELSATEVENYRIAGLLHDAGKIGVPEAVLCKPGRLTDEEFGLIKLHPETGHRILKDIDALADILPGVLSHHERWDGRGYPHGLTGTAIAPVARVLALADTFDAMSSNRSYRAGLPREKVMAEIARSGGTQFDPDLVPLFLKLNLSQYDAMLYDFTAQAKAA